jgi:photosystem II stability/assembly factor-like uncharacterized protein
MATWNVPRAIAAVLVTLAVAAVPNPAAAAPAFPVVQSLASSTEVHSLSFITPSRGWALVGTRLLQTNQAGSSWSISVPQEWRQTLPRAISFTSPTRGWMVADRGLVFLTSDGGAHWTPRTAEMISGHDLSAVHGLGNSTAVVASRDGRIFMTSDVGATWSLRYSAGGGSLQAICFTDASHGWVAGVDASGKALLLATVDGGATWVPRVTPQASALTAVAFVDSVHGWAAGPAGVLSTSDGGATWVAKAAPSELLGAQRVSLAFVSATHGFLGKSRTASGGTTLWETKDGGASWAPCSIAEESAGVSSIAVLGTRVLATGASKPAGATLTSARIWCGELGASSPTIVASTSSKTTAAAKKAAAKAAKAKKAAAKRAAAKKAAKAKKRTRR